MSMTHAMQAIKQAIQRKSNCNSGQESKHNDYDDYGDYSETHSGHYHMDLSEGECHGDYGDVHGDYYDFDFQEEEVAVRPEQSVKSPMPNILERINNRLFQNTK
ncbi:MAG: hypothetical protein UIC65_03480 [Alphaproteobacteria bacterium]|nr:hypothetical protein [Alphaproteobacteria bacterium]